MFEKNIQAISTKNPVLAQKLLDHQPANIDYNITTSGDYNLIYNGIHLHDKEDPQLEAKLIFGEEDNSDAALRLVFGLGLGYLFKRAYISSIGTIILFEPLLDVLRATLDSVDFSSELSDPRVFIFSDVSELQQAFYKYLYDNVSIMHLDSYKDMLPELYDQVFYELNRLYLDQQTNIKKSVSISNAMVTNLPEIVKLPSVACLKDKFKDKAALVVSAGPSLDKSIDTIRENRNKFVVISIGQAFKALYKANIMPDLVVIVDMLPLLHQIDFLGDEVNKINLVLQPAVDKEFFSVNTKSSFIYLPKSDYLSEWYAGRAETSTLQQGCTVSICAFYLAELMGANPIILVGQDLAYASGRIYASNSIYDSMKYTVSSDGKLNAYIDTPDPANDQLEKDKLLKNNIPDYEKVLKVKGQNGEELFTSNGYASFITHYVQIANDVKLTNPDITLINASEGGAYLEGFEHKPLKDCVNDLPLLMDNPLEVISDLYVSLTRETEKIKRLNLAFNKLLADLRNLKDDSAKVKKLCARAKSELKNSKTMTKKLADAIKRLQKADNLVRKYNEGDKISFIYPFIQKELFKYNKITDQQVNSDFENIAKYIESAEAFSEAMFAGSVRVLESFKNIDEFPFKE